MDLPERMAEEGAVLLRALAPLGVLTQDKHLKKGLTGYSSSNVKYAELTQRLTLQPPLATVLKRTSPQNLLIRITFSCRIKFKER